jgi:hypothetical protein
MEQQSAEEDEVEEARVVVQLVVTLPLLRSELMLELDSRSLALALVEDRQLENRE